ncbi:MAG TPA: acyl-CoA desaturase [Syntrophorhabdaceae bacterium]|jgi:linoleoyl-CoA desaturase
MAGTEGPRQTSAERTGQATRSILKLEFGDDRSFENDLRRRVDEYFTHVIGQSRQGNRQMYLKTGIILASLITFYLLLVFTASSIWQALPLSILLGFSVAGIGFNIAHDGGHGAYSKNRVINKLAAMTMDLAGVSSYVWFWKHSVIHHRYVNITGYDTDVDIGILGRLSPHSRRLPFHRWQHLYLWLLYGFLAAKMQFVDDFKRVIRGRIGGHGFPRPKGWDLVIFVFGKVVFFAWAFAIPFIFHPLGAVLLFYCVGVSVLGIMLSVVFQLPHCVGQSEFPQPEKETGRMKNPWAVHQARVALDFARNSRIVRWPVGGLNFHLEHHLLPTICHIHYPALTKIVEQTCRDHGVKYAEHPTFRSGIASHYRWLKLMGAPDKGA